MSSNWLVRTWGRRWLLSRARRSCREVRMAPVRDSPVLAAISRAMRSASMLLILMAILCVVYHTGRKYISIYSPRQCQCWRETRAIVNAGAIDKARIVFWQGWWLSGDPSASLDDSGPVWFMEA